MLLRFDLGVEISGLLALFEQALKEAKCTFQWIPVSLTQSLGEDVDKGIVAYMQINGKQQRKVRIVLRPLLTTHGYKTKTKHVIIDFGSEEAKHPLSDTVSHPQKTILSRKYGKDFDSIIAKLSELLEPSTSTIVTMLVHEKK